MKRVSSFIFYLLIVVSLVAQPQGKILPIDKNVRYGKLANGLTYYIRHNALPEKRAGFYIAQKVGSMQEDDSQLGLAHFLEHMAFNGSANFPGRKKVVSFVENNGGQFGVNINAYTSYDETVYNLSDIALSDNTAIDSCLLILHDWSGFLTLDNAEIDKERAIIKEEWRTRNNTQFRLSNKLFSIFFEGSKYANRAPIGSMDIVENFKYQELKDYYHKWYRPDLQGIIAVGDFDAAEVEQKLKTIFADIPPCANTAKRVYYPVPNNKKPQVAIITDPEATSTSVAVYFKHEPIANKLRMTDSAIYQSLLGIVASQCLSNRLSDISRKSDAPFVNAGVSVGNFMIATTKNSWTLSAIPKEGEIQNALTEILRENMRAYTHGFTNSEIERIKSSLLASYESMYNNRNKQNSSNYISEYVRSFLNQEPIPGIEVEYNLVKDLLPAINPQTVKAYMHEIISRNNIAVAIAGPEKEKVVYPNEKTVNKIIERSFIETTTPLVEEEAPSTLIEKLPAKGKVVDITTDEKWGTTNWTLSNGMKVILKKTDYKDDQIILTGISGGGMVQFPDSDAVNANFINDVVGLGGLASFSNSDLKKILIGKSAAASASVSLTTQGVRGVSSIKDLETLFQIVYLQLTAPRKDEEAYSIYTTQLKRQLEDASKNPHAMMNDTISSTMYGNNPRIRNIKPDDVDKLNYDRVLQMYKTSFSNPAALTIILVGTIDETSVKPLVEQYLASLPQANQTKAQADESYYWIKKGSYAKTVYANMQTPKASVFNMYSGKIQRNLKNSLTLDLFKQVLDIMFTQNVREDEGGTYGVNTSIACNRFPEGLTTLQIMYDTDIAKLERIKPIVNACVTQIAQDGVTPDVLNMLFDYMLKRVETAWKTDDYWASFLSTYYFYGEDNNSDYISTLKSITSDDIKNIASELLKQDNFIEVIMIPEKR